MSVDRQARHDHAPSAATPPPGIDCCWIGDPCPEHNPACTNRPYLVRVIREALEQHAIPRHDKPGCSICQGALAALEQLLVEEATERSGRERG
jgi:hypothetical protein